MPPTKESPKDRRNRLARERRAKKRALREKRSLAAKKGWEKRRAREKARIYTPEVVAELDALKKENEELKKERGTLVKELTEEKVFNAEIREAKKELIQIFLQQETPTERYRRMQRTWVESEALISAPGKSRYLQLVIWAQRNGFDIKEFWAEYRRRSGK